MSETEKPDRLLEVVREELAKLGVDLDCCGSPDGQPRVICVKASLGESIEEMSRSARDQVVMVRLDKPSLETLDAWVATGIAKSRSEAAALFLREGLRLRARELSDLKEALAKVEEAKRQLRERAKDVLGDDRSTRE